MKTRLTKLAALAVAGTLTFGAAAPVNAWAACPHNAPTTEITEKTIADANVVRASGNRAAAFILEMLGANIKSGFGLVNGGAPTAEDALGNFALEVSGTDNNVNPDPYWWNYYYNFNGGNSSNALININAQGSPVMADTVTVSPLYGGVSVSLYTRPDVLVGVSKNNSVTDTSGYDSQLETIRATGEVYNPLLVAYNSATLDTMMDTVYDVAEMLRDTGKPTRYGDPILIANEYADYIMGIKGYIKEAIGQNNYKTIAIVSAANEDGTYTIQGLGTSAVTSTNRYVEYTEDVTNNLTSSASATATSAQLAGVDAIVITSDAAEAAVKGDATILAGDPELISANEVKCHYGISMNSAENALGMGYILARIYDDSASVLNAKYVYEYFASKFYHIRASRLDCIYHRAIVDNIDPDDGEYADLHIGDNAYDEETLEALFAAYAQYY